MYLDWTRSQAGTKKMTPPTETLMQMAEQQLDRIDRKQEAGMVNAMLRYLDVEVSNSKRNAHRRAAGWLW